MEDDGGYLAYQLELEQEYRELKEIEEEYKDCLMRNYTEDLYHGT